MAKVVRGSIRGEGSQLEREIRMRFEAVKAMLNERARRLWAAAETRAAGVGCEMDTNRYATGIKVSDAELSMLTMTPNPFHGEWNDTITPRATPPVT